MQIKSVKENLLTQVVKAEEKLKTSKDFNSSSHFALLPSIEQEYHSKLQELSELGYNIAKARYESY